MKRSQRLYIRAKNSAMWTLLLLVSALAFGAWFVRASMTDHWSTLALAIAALASLFAAFGQAGETRRLLDQANREQAYEGERSISPRI